jgi:putative effector of murein hydrolase
MPADLSALFWIVATLGCYALAKGLNRLYPAWWTAPLLLTCALCLVLALCLHTGYGEYMRGGRFLLMLLGPATVAFALPIYEQRQLIRRYWSTLLLGVFFGCVLALGGVWLVSGWLDLPQVLRLSLLPRSFTTPFAMAFAKDVGGSPDLAAVCVIATGVIGASLGSLLLQVLPLHTSFARGAMLGMGAHGAGVAKAREIGAEEEAVAGLVMILAGVSCALLGPLISLLES